MAELCRRVKDLQPPLPYLFPVLHHRGSPASGLDVENSVFVFDLQGYDEFKRGKAASGRTSSGAFARTRLVNSGRARRGAALTLMRITYCGDDQ